MHTCTCTHVHVTLTSKVTTAEVPLVALTGYPLSQDYSGGGNNEVIKTIRACRLNLTCTLYVFTRKLLFGRSSANVGSGMPCAPPLEPRFSMYAKCFGGCMQGDSASSNPRLCRKKTGEMKNVLFFA